MSDYATCASHGAFEPPTVEGVLKIMADFERQWPASERAVAAELPPSTEEALLHYCGQLFARKSPAAFPRQSLYGLPIEINLEVPFRSYIIRMADGSRVMHYLSGRKVRCLPGANDQ